MTVRAGRNGERLELLDGGMAYLNSADLIIADRNRPLALAGVMGGRGSAVRGRPSTIVVEAGTFRPHLVRRTARRHGLQTDAALRSSKLLPPTLAAHGLRRFLALLQQYGTHGKSNFGARRPHRIRALKR